MPNMNAHVPNTPSSVYYIKKLANVQKEVKYRGQGLAFTFIIYSAIGKA